MDALKRATCFLVLALLQLGCASQIPLVGNDGAPNGRIQVTSATLGNVELTPAACISGEHQLFFGADFLDSAKGTTVRLILAPTGEATLRAFKTANPLGPGVVFQRNACRKFQVSFERTGWRINDVYDARVSLEVDCGSTPGDSLQGMLAAAHCH